MKAARWSEFAIEAGKNACFKYSVETYVLQNQTNDVIKRENGSRPARCRARCTVRLSLRRVSKVVPRELIDHDSRPTSSVRFRVYTRTRDFRTARVSNANGLKNIEKFRDKYLLLLTSRPLIFYKRNNRVRKTVKINVSCFTQRTKQQLAVK